MFESIIRSAGFFLVHVIFISVFIAQNANAIVLPSTERPVYGAQMQIDASTGIFDQIQHVGVSLAQAKNSMEPTSVILTADGQTYTLPIVEVIEDPCGALEFLAATHKYVITLKDHAPLKCQQPGELIYAAWNGKIEALSETGDSIGEIQVSGQPEPMFSIQIEQHYY